MPALLSSSVASKQQLLTSGACPAFPSVSCFHLLGSYVASCARPACQPVPAPHMSELLGLFADDSSDGDAGFDSETADDIAGGLKARAPVRAPPSGKKPTRLQRKRERMGTKGKGGPGSVGSGARPPAGGEATAEADGAGVRPPSTGASSVTSHAALLFSKPLIFLRQRSSSFSNLPTGEATCWICCVNGVARALASAHCFA